MILIYFFALITTLFAAWRTGRRLRYFLHVFQLEGYKRNEFRQWLKKRMGHVVRFSHKLAVVVLALAFVGFFFLSPFWTALFALPAWAITFASSRLYRSTREKKPLKYTNRMKRLLSVSAGITAIPVLLGIVFGVAEDGLEGFFWYLAGFLLADFGAPFWVLMASLVLDPVERSIQQGFKEQARNTIRSRPDITVIGITGSYGKTSVKFIISEILKQRYQVLATPASYNTPMGICLVINQQLRPEHQVLILEMGARYSGDIRELCEIAPPDIGVVTTVGVAHLETMGSVENIAEEKGSLLEFMKPGGTAILNADNEYVAAMDKKARGKVWRVSVSGKKAEITAENIRYGPEGASFLVRDDTGSEQVFRTQLLGQHNVLNILLGVAVGREMGLRLRQIAHAVNRLKPVEHRLQLRREGPATVIDDAFNSNPIGARNALEILGQFDTGRRIIITPGMVELGERQWDENRAFGEYMARHVDLALLVGTEQTRPIQEGLRAQNFPRDNVKVFKSLFDAQAYLKSLLRPGDVVLYENDLPDQYTER